MKKQNREKQFYDISDHTPKSILTRANFSFSDRAGHSTEFKMQQNRGYYAKNLDEYLYAFEIETPDCRETWILSDILEKFGQCCKYRDVFYFWISDPAEKPPIRRIWK